MWLDKLLEDFFLFIKQQKIVVNTDNKVLIIKAISYVDISNKKQLYALLSSFIVNNKIELEHFKYFFFVEAFSKPRKICIKFTIFINGMIKLN